ncbi:long-chain fatty acid transport protein 1-like [Osmerus eperlanus]|uniref:long-chain fatty acid transport protein 1-like n=1 Tax=Osmerus eperlanus TaxID=29151 RepID=UPI002E15CBA0
MAGLVMVLRVRAGLCQHHSLGSTVPSLFSQRVALHPDKPALVDDHSGEVWTFRELAEQSHAVAHWALAQGWEPGDVVALYLESRPWW